MPCFKHQHYQDLNCGLCKMVDNNWGEPPAVEIKPRKTDPDTAKPGPRNVRDTEAAIVAFLKKIAPYGLNSRELSRALGRPREIISPCLRPMERLGLIRVIGKRRDEVTGATCLVWGI